MSRSGFQVLISAVIFFQSGLLLITLIALRGEAVPVCVCPIAVPIQLVPKSKPRTVIGSGITGGWGELVEVKAECVKGHLPLFVDILVEGNILA